MSHRIYGVVIGLCLIVFSVAACSSAQPAAAPAEATAAPPQGATSAPPTTAPTPLPPTATPTVEPTAEPTAEPTQPAAQSGTTIDMNNPIFKAYFAVYNKFPRRASAEVYNADTQKTTTVLIETDAKDHLHIETGDMGNEAFAMIIISPTMYIKQGNTWQKLPGAQASMFLSMLTDVDSLQQLLNAFGELTSYTVTPLGPEALDGVPAMTYASEFTMKDGTSSTSKAWIGADGLLIRDRIETSDGAVITTTYTFDPGIKVEAPIP